MGTSRRWAAWFAAAAALALVGCTGNAGSAGGASDTGGVEASATRSDTPVVESIYAVRAMRTSRAFAPDLSALCTGLSPLAQFEDVFDLYSFNTRSSDGVVVNGAVTHVGTLRTCFSQAYWLTTPPQEPAEAAGGHYAYTVRSAYELGGMTLTGDGVCDVVHGPQDGSFVYPVPGSSISRCRVDLDDGQSVRGLSINSGATARNELTPPFTATDGAGDPNKYGLHETSFLLVRIWRSR